MPHKNHRCTGCGKQLYDRAKTNRCRQCNRTNDPTPEEIEAECRKIRRERAESDRKYGPHDNLGRPQYVKRRHRLVLPEGARYE